MAKILMVHPGPEFSVADVFRGWTSALKDAGHRMRVYNTNDRLAFYGSALFEDPNAPPCEHCGVRPVRKALPESFMIANLSTAGLVEEVFRHRPDVIFYVSAFFHQEGTLKLFRDHGIKQVMLYTESPYQDDEQMLRGQYADFNLLNDPTNIQKWADLGVPVAYVPHSFDPQVHYQAEEPREYESDFAFVGTGFRSRCEFFTPLLANLHEAGIEVALGGNAWDQIDPEFYPLLDFLGHRPDQCVDNSETARVYRASKVGINFYRRESEDTHRGEGWSMGPREVEMAACGLFFIRDPRPESDEVFPMLPTFSSPGEAEELIKYYVRHDRERESLAYQAAAAVQDRTFDNHCKQVLELMEGFGII